MPSSSTALLFDRPQFLQFHVRVTDDMTHPFSPRPATGADRLVGVGRRRDRRTQAYHARNRAAEIIRRRKRMGPGGSRGLQIRRRRGSAGTGGFDSHTLPPIHVAGPCSRPASQRPRGSAGCRLDREPGLSLRPGSRIAKLLASVTSARLFAMRSDERVSLIFVRRDRGWHRYE